MRTIKTLTLALLLATGISSIAADNKDSKDKPYPLDKCVVSDEKLGEMGKPYVFTHEGREVQLCCESCKKDFNKEPAKYLKKLDKAEKKADKKK